jgi:hypothetical protein
MSTRLKITKNVIHLGRHYLKDGVHEVEDEKHAGELAKGGWAVKTTDPVTGPAPVVPHQQKEETPQVDAEKETPSTGTALGDLLAMKPGQLKQAVNAWNADHPDKQVTFVGADLPATAKALAAAAGYKVE